MRKIRMSLVACSENLDEELFASACKSPFESHMNFEKGGKGGSSAPAPLPTPPPMVAPKPPVEEASVELDDPKKRKRQRTGKSSLKGTLPFAIGKKIGLKL